MAEIDYGLCFHIDNRLIDKERVHFMQAALVSARPTPPIVMSLRYKLPEQAPHGPRRLGASETLGIFGGIDDQAQRTLSEIVERNIGDILTMALMQLLLNERDRMEDGVPKRLVVLGPPIPKVVGRFASLRMPREFKVGWFYCFPGHAWLASFPGWNIVSRAGHRVSRLWMEDELIVEDSKVIGDVEYHVGWLNQYVSFEDVYKNGWMESVERELLPAPWIDESALVPPVLALAALFALAERGRMLGLPVFPISASHIDLMAAACYDDTSRPGLKSFGQMREQIARLESAKRGRFKLERELRGSDIVVLSDIPVLVDAWNELQAPIVKETGKS